MSRSGSTDPGDDRRDAGPFDDVDDLTMADVPALTKVAERLDELADTADLMGDEAHAGRLREAARGHRMRAMELLDD